MPLVKKEEPTIDELEERKERAVLEEEILTKEAESEERRAVISELRKKYGKGWAKRLGLSKLTDISTLRSFLRGSKQGMEKQATGYSNPELKKSVVLHAVRRA